jgi:hypothetical protein
MDKALQRCLAHCIAALALLALAGCGKEPAAKPAPPPVDVKEDAISRQDYDDALTAVKQQQAAVDSAQAALSSASIDLG